MSIIIILVSFLYLLPVLLSLLVLCLFGLLPLFSLLPLLFYESLILISLIYYEALLNLLESCLIETKSLMHIKIMRIITNISLYILKCLVNIKKTFVKFIVEIVKKDGIVKYNNLGLIKNYSVSNSIRNFSSTSLPPILPLPNKIVINSTFDNIVFVDDQSALFLPPIHIDMYLLEKEKNMEVLNLPIPFFENLIKVFNNLDKGLYRFDLYLYYESCLLMSVYTSDFFNKNCFNKKRGNYGYGRSISQEIKIEKVFTEVETMVGLSGEIGGAINSLREDKNFNISLNKEVILVIKKYY